MDMHSAIKKLLKFMEQSECQDFLELANQAFFCEFAEKYGCEDACDIQEALGEVAFEQVYPCALEFFFSNDYIKDRHISKEPWNIIDLFLKKRRTMLSLNEKEYLRSLRHSHMSLYEVTKIVPEQSLTLRDLLEDKAPITVFEKSLTRCVGQWEIMGLRVVTENGKPALSGGCLRIDRKVSDSMVKLIRAMHQEGMRQTRAGKYGDAPQNMEAAGRLFRVMWVKEIAYTYMVHAYEQQHREVMFQNSDGHALQYCTVEFPLRADWREIAKLLKRVPDFDFEENGRARKFWNWYSFAQAKASPASKGRKSAKKQTRKSASQDDNVQFIETQLDSPRLDRIARNLGTIELLKTKMFAEANSRERAEILEKKLYEVLGGRIGQATWEIKIAADIREAPKRGKDKRDTSPDLGDIDPEEAAESMHAMLRMHYEAFLTSPLDDLDKKSPMEMCTTEAGRKKVAELLKGLENNQRRLERDQPIISPMDMTWIWEKLGLAYETARRS
jgi:hypothetical protein